MTRKRRISEYDAPAQALGFENVDAMIRQRILAGKRRMDIAAELGAQISAISKRLLKYHPDIASGPDGLDRRHHFVVAKYLEGMTVAEVGQIDKIGERRVAKILKAEEARTGETLIRPATQRNQAARPKSTAASVWNDDGTGRKPPRKIRETTLPCGWQRGDEPVILTIASNELWCKKCGTVAYKNNCPRCEGETLTPAIQILRPGEYRLAGVAA